MVLDLNIIRKVCTEKGLKENSISSFPTFADVKHKTGNGSIEGIEVKGGKIIPFWSIEGQRNYEEPTSERILAIIHEIGERMSTEQDIKESEPSSIKDAIQKDKEAAKKPESKSLILSETLLSKDALGIELPEFMTAKLMEKWESLTTFERVLFFQKTPVDKIDHVIVGKKDGKNLTAPYVKGNYMFKEANAAFLYDWYISDVVITVGIKGVSAVGTLYAWFKEYNKYLQRPATGYQELNGQVDAELARKGAITDAIKKGLSLFGFNSDVYSGERD